MPGPSPQFVGILQEVFGAKKLKVDTPFPILPSKPKRTIGDASLFAEAQRIYNPAVPMTPGKGAPSAMADKGTGPALDAAPKGYLDK